MPCETPKRIFPKKETEGLNLWLFLSPNQHTPASSRLKGKLQKRAPRIRESGPSGGAGLVSEGARLRDQGRAHGLSLESSVPGPRWTGQQCFTSNWFCSWKITSQCFPSYPYSNTANWSDCHIPSGLENFLRLPSNLLSKPVAQPFRAQRFHLYFMT